MSKVLVVYGTATGCTEGVARYIGDAIAEAGNAVDIVPAKDDPDPAGYDAVLVGSGVRAGSWHAPVKEWVTRRAEALKAGRTAFFTACLTLASEPEKTAEVRAYTDALMAETGVEPVDVGLFAGWNEPKRFSLIERTILKLMKAPQGDFRDQAAIASWARDVSVSLGTDA